MIVNQSNAWLVQDPSNVIAIHCKGGKGRTGMVISCLLLKQGVTDTPEAALRYFAERRTKEHENNDKENVKIQKVSSACCDVL